MGATTMGNYVPGWIVLMTHNSPSAPTPGIPSSSNSRTIDSGDSLRCLCVYVAFLRGGRGAREFALSISFSFFFFLSFQLLLELLSLSLFLSFPIKPLVFLFSVIPLPMSYDNAKVVENYGLYPINVCVNPILMFPSFNNTSPYI